MRNIVMKLPVFGNELVIKNKGRRVSRMIPKCLVYITICLMKPIAKIRNIVEDYIWEGLGWGEMCWSRTHVFE